MSISFSFIIHIFKLPAFQFHLPRTDRHEGVYERNKFAYLTMKKGSFASFPRVFVVVVVVVVVLVVVFVHFAAVLVLFTTSNDLFCAFGR